MQVRKKKKNNLFLVEKILFRLDKHTESFGFSEQTILGSINHQNKIT